MKGVKRAISFIETKNIKNAEKNQKTLLENKLEAVTN